MSNADEPYKAEMEMSQEFRRILANAAAVLKMDEATLHKTGLLVMVMLAEQRQKQEGWVLSMTNTEFLDTQIIDLPGLP